MHSLLRGKSLMTRLFIKYSIVQFLWWILFHTDSGLFSLVTLVTSRVDNGIALLEFYLWANMSVCSAFKLNEAISRFLGYMCIRVIHLKDSNKSVASYVWLKGFKIVHWIQIHHNSVIITVYKVIENHF